MENSNLVSEKSFSSFLDFDPAKDQETNRESAQYPKIEIKLHKTLQLFLAE